MHSILSKFTSLSLCLGLAFIVAASPSGPDSIQPPYFSENQQIIDYLNELEVVDYKDLVDKQLDEDLLKPSKPTSEKLSHFIQKRESDEAVSENENGKAAEIIPNSDLDQRGGPPNENDNSKNGTGYKPIEAKSSCVASADPTLVRRIQFAFEGICLSFIAIGGIGGNLISMFILLRRKLDLQPFLCRLLVLLVIFDTIFLFTDFVNFSLPSLSNFFERVVKPKVGPHFMIPLSQIALTGSVYSIVAITVERYFSCCWPHFPPREGPLVNLACIAGIVLFSVCYNITRFFEFHVTKRVSYEDLIKWVMAHPEAKREGLMAYVEEVYNAQPLIMNTTALRNSKTYQGLYLLAANSTVMVIIPLVSLVILNWKIYKAIKTRERYRATLTANRRSRECRASSIMESDDSGRTSQERQREVTISQILITIVMMFFICQSFKVIVVSYEVVAFIGDDCKNPLWIELVINLNHIALAVNAAVNILIYICKDKKFRTAFFELFPKCTNIFSNQDPPPQTQTNSTEMTPLNGVRVTPRHEGQCEMISRISNGGVKVEKVNESPPKLLAPYAPATMA